MWVAGRCATCVAFRSVAFVIALSMADGWQSRCSTPTAPPKTLPQAPLLRYLGGGLAVLGGGARDWSDGGVGRDGKAPHDFGANRAALHRGCDVEP